MLRPERLPVLLDVELVLVESPSLETAVAVLGVTRRVLHLITTTTSSGAERSVGRLIIQNIVHDLCLQHSTAALFCSTQF